MGDLIFKPVGNIVELGGKADLFGKDVSALLVETTVLKKLMGQTNYSRMPGVNNVVVVSLRKMILDLYYIAAAQRAAVELVLMLPCEKVVTITATI